jgi:hypothetical protein
MVGTVAAAVNVPGVVHVRAVLGKDEGTGGDDRGRPDNQQQRQTEIVTTYRHGSTPWWCG